MLRCHAAFRRRLQYSSQGIAKAVFFLDVLYWQLPSRTRIPLCRLSTTRLDFREQGRWEGFRSLLRTQKEDVRLPDVVSALNALKLSKVPAPISLLQELRDLILERTGDLDAQDASNILHAFAKLKFADPVLINAVLKQIRNGHVRLCRFDNRDLATLIYSLGHLKAWSGMKDTEENVQAVVPMVIEEMQTPYREGTFDSPTLVNMLYGLGNLRCRHNGIESFVDLMLKEETLSELNEQLYSMLVSALDELKWPLNGDRWQLLLNELRKEARRKSFNGQGLCNVVRRLGPMGCPSKDVFKLLIEESIDPERMESYSSQDIANLIHTIAVQDINPGHYLPKFERRMIHPTVLGKYKENELCSIIYGFSLKRLEGKTLLFEILSKEVVRGKRLRRYTQQGLSMLLYSFGIVKFFNLEVMHILAQECTMPGRLTSFSNQSLSNMIYGLGRLRIDDGKLRRFAEFLLEESSTDERLIAFNEQALANIIYSLAQLRMPQYLKPFVMEAGKPKRLKLLTDQGLSNILQSFSWLGSRDVDNVRVFMSEVIKRSKAGSFSELARSNVMTAAIGFGHKMETISSAFFRLSNPRDQLKNQSSASLMSTLDKFVRFEKRTYALVWPIVSELTYVRRLKKLTDQEVADVLKLIYRLGLVASKATPKVVKHIRETDRIRHMTPSTMGDALIAICWLQYPETDIYMDLAQSLTIPDRLRQLTTTQIIDILHGLKPKLVPLRFTEAMIDHLCQDLRSLRGHQLVDVLQFHVNFGARNEERVTSCLDALVRPEMTTELTLKDVALGLEALLSMGLQELNAVHRLIGLLDQPTLYLQCRVHYVAKTIICLCRLGPEHKKRTKALIDQLVEPPWSKDVAEKDLTDVLKIVKTVDYDYGKLGRLLNQNRRRMQELRQTSIFLTEEDTELVERAGRT